MAGNYENKGQHYRRNPHRYRYRGGRKTQKVHCISPSGRCIWQPAIPQWERKFCREVGLFEWNEFKEAKKQIDLLSTKVMDWDDYAVQQAFHNAKNRFKAILDGHPINDDDFLGYAKMYLDDEVDFEEDLQLYLEIDQIRHDTKEEVEEMPAQMNIRMEDIVPTGWDVDIGEINRQIYNPDLSGMIVGE